VFAEQERCERIALELADAAGEILRRRFRRPMAVETKQDRSPVSQIDLEVERALRAHLERVAPEHGVIGEELGELRPDAELVWVIDPIDGTRAFVTGRPTFVTLIGLLHLGKPVIGVIDQPILAERWIGGVGLQTRFLGENALVRRCPDLSQAWVGATEPSMFPGPLAIGFGSISGRARQTIWGGDGYLYGQLASGHLDCVVEAGLKLHDFVALAPVVAGAGGVITDWRGRELDRASDGLVVASGDPRLHDQAVSILRATVEGIEESQGA
jgi:inositol-phosphate phosphatase/L-galactose 1-phosphate phosphatase/histidinol-phosphatase